MTEIISAGTFIQQIKMGAYASALEAKRYLSRCKGTYTEDEMHDVKLCIKEREMQGWTKEVEEKPEETVEEKPMEPEEPPQKQPKADAVPTERHKLLQLVNDALATKAKTPWHATVMSICAHEAWTEASTEAKEKAADVIITYGDFKSKFHGPSNAPLYVLAACLIISGQSAYKVLQVIPVTEGDGRKLKAYERTRNALQGVKVTKVRKRRKKSEPPVLVVRVKRALDSGVYRTPEDVLKAVQHDYQGKDWKSAPDEAKQMAYACINNHFGVEQETPNNPALDLSKHLLRNGCDRTFALSIVVLTDDERREWYNTVWLKKNEETARHLLLSWVDERLETDVWKTPLHAVAEMRESNVRMKTLPSCVQQEVADRINKHFKLVQHPRSNPTFTLATYLVHEFDVPVHTVTQLLALSSDERSFLLVTSKRLEAQQLLRDSTQLNHNPTEQGMSTVSDEKEPFIDFLGKVKKLLADNAWSSFSEAMSGINTQLPFHALEFEQKQRVWQYISAYIKNERLRDGQNSEVDEKEKVVAEAVQGTENDVLTLEAQVETLREQLVEAQKKIDALTIHANERAEDTAESMRRGAELLERMNILEGSGVIARKTLESNGGIVRELVNRLCTLEGLVSQLSVRTNSDSELLCAVDKSVNALRDSVRTSDNWLHGLTKSVEQAVDGVNAAEEKLAAFHSNQEAPKPFNITLSIGNTHIIVNAPNSCADNTKATLLAHVKQLALELHNSQKA
jgi:hypothetical protein